MRCSSKALDHLGLIAGMVDELGIVEVIDSAITQDQEKRHLSIGQVVKASIINGLGFTGRPLYLTPQFFATKPLDLLIGEGIEASHINDNTIGRALDALYRYGVSPLFGLIAARAHKVLGLESAYAHLDSTSFKVYGDDYTPSKKYVTINEDGNEERPSVIEVTHGYSKDHRPDLSQVMLNMIVENSAGIPLAIEALSGNSSDKSTFGASVNRYKELIQTHTANQCIVADAALYSKANLETLKHSHLYWLTRVPETISEAQEMIIASYSSQEWSACKEDERYHYITHTSFYGDVSQLWVIVSSSEARKRALSTLLRRYKKQSDKEIHAIDVLCKERFACEADANKELAKLQKTLRLTQIASSIESTARYKGKGRPAISTEPDYYEYRILCTPLSSSLELYQQELHTKSCFILATNDTTKTAESLIDAYKNQYVVERGFAFLKSKEFFADALYLKSPERLEALLMIMALSLMVYTALEYRIRRELKSSSSTFWDQKGKPTKRPTARWVFWCFEGVQQLRMHDTAERLILNLNDRHRLIISLLGRAYEKIYGLESGV